MLCVLILYVSGGTYSLMSTPNDRFLRYFFMAGFLLSNVLPEVCWGKIAVVIIFFSYFVLMADLGYEPRLYILYANTLPARLRRLHFEHYYSETHIPWPWRTALPHKSLTYIHNWPTFSQANQLASHATYVVCANFIHERRNLQFKVDSKRQIFGKLFMAIWLTFRFLARNIFSYFV